MKLIFVADDFKLRTPVQQLLDRFLMGYRDYEIVLVAPQSNPDIERRIKDFGLRWQSESLNSDGALIFNKSESSSAPRTFVHGVSTRHIAGTGVRGAWLLPNISAAKPAKGLVIVQGDYPVAEMEALDALMPLIWRKGAKVRNVVRLRGTDFWSALKREFWPLVKSAISRSDSPQGDAVRDGRTQDLVGFGLLESLVKESRGWLIEHDDGFRYAIAVMDGAVADYNLALQTRVGGIVSAQVHRGPPPYEQHYRRLAAMLERYFRTGVPPWPPEQSLLIAELGERFNKG